LIKEGIEIVEHARKMEVSLRILGGCAVRIHCPAHVELHKIKMQRKIPDIDFATLGKHKASVRNLMGKLGFEPELVTVEGERAIYENKVRGITTDVFFGKIQMCHVLDIKERLEIDFPTITLADLILTKLQVVKINKKDINDVIVLLLEHEIGDSDEGTINLGYIAKLLSNDWGFYYTVTSNLRKIEEGIETYRDLLKREEEETVRSKIENMVARLKDEPKSMKWKIREKVGTKKIWYTEVEEQQRGSLAEYLTNQSKEKQEHND
jgi:hypothetical protein